MKRVAFFCIPAHGHTNPMLPVAAELVRRGNAVRFYSFDVFEKKIKAAGAEFISCDVFLPKLSGQEEAGLKSVSATEMTVQDIRITLSMNDFLDKEFRSFQPYAESFSDHYAFVGPSVFSGVLPEKEKARPLVYIAMGTVINDRPDFYRKCIHALGSLQVDVILSCGDFVNRKELGDLPEHIRVYPHVDQPAVLARADVFLTHCGMNSVSESLYMAAPMVLYPQTGEQFAVARRVMEIGAAEFIEDVPHASGGMDMIKELNRVNAKCGLLYWLLVAALILLSGFLAGWQYALIIGIAAGILAVPVGRAMQKKNYAGLCKRTVRGAP
ncbi:MAG: hypothetical protein K2P48_05160 [Lachnospiraceae bacterium]|nr:hypothetical protein [Lachnospiraceae bacterium]